MILLTQMKLKFLGTSNGAGIPVHNCSCSTCEYYRKNKQSNLSTCSYIELDNKSVILIDAGVENIANIFDKRYIKAIFLTHFHSDHALGLLRLRYSYQKILCFHPKDEEGFANLFKHKMSIRYIENKEFKPIYADEIIFIPIPLSHSKNTTGYLIKTKNSTIAYLTDCYAIPNLSLNFLKAINIDYVFIDATYSPLSIGNNHLNYEEATLLIDEIKPKSNGFLMHASHKTLSYIADNKIELKYKYINKGFELTI